MRLIKNIFLEIAFLFFKLVLCLRYSIEIKGLENITKNGGGILFLPNHPAEMDPLILIKALWRDFRPRPLAVEHHYYQKGLRFFMDLVRVLPLPTMEVGNQWKVRQVEKLKDKISSKLAQGESFLIYPSGQLKSSPDEKIGGASMAADLLNQNPEARVVLIRTTGLWGSTFSRAITGSSPDFASVLWHGFKVILKNGIFFAPRRHVLVEIEAAPKDLPRTAEKMEINRYLENWYNKSGPEPLKLVSFAFWKNEVAEIEAIVQEDIEEIHVPEERKVQILAFLSKMTRRPISDFKPKVNLFHDLGLDSLDVSQLNVFLEERFDITGLAPGQIQTVHDLLQAGAGVRKDTDEAAPPKKLKWAQETNRPNCITAEGDTIAEVFLNSCERMGDSIACADALAGVRTYSKLKRAALVLALEIEKMPGDHIGILLPSSVGAYVSIIATMLAGKIPVMLNWTTGFRNLEHAQEVCGIKAVLSSFRFLSRIENIDLGKVDDALILLEKLRSEISLKTKLKGLFRSFLSPSQILKKIPNPPKGDDTAAVIFTSGTETLPKGVPLTHNNLLSNQRLALSCVNILPEDSLYAVLPPFHSFGFSVTGLMPLLAGIKVCYAPDPTDSRSMANDIEHWKPTIFCCAPSFVMGMLRIASDEQLSSLRMVVTGAEKTPQELYDTLIAKGKIVLEGYGISECSPIVTIERETESRNGVGRPIPETELIFIDPETEEVLEEGSEGEVCIHGPSVFKGYLGVKRDPFIKRKGKLWYRSGDRGRVDADGTLIITGRLKRFVKMGGEMISLGGLEEDLLRICREKELISKQVDGPPLSVVATGRESEKPQLILFSAFDVERETVNTALKEMGHGRLIKIAEVKKLDEIPLTGTGKTHYRLLEEMV